MTVRYVDTATVSDEHGKGVEILRQQVVQSAGNGTYIVMVAEVDSVVRYIEVVRHGAGVAQDVIFYKRQSGAATGARVALTANTTLTAAVAPRNGIVELPLVVSTLEKDDIVECVTTGTGTGVSMHFGWMPDMFTLEAQARTYSLPS